jgi:MFS family permease
MAEPAPHLEVQAVTSNHSAYRWFVLGVAFWFLAWGMQQVLFSWLVVGELRLDGDRVGLAQTCLTLPALLGLLIGGVVADRVDRRLILIVLYSAGAVAVATLAGIVHWGWLTLAAVLVFAATMGTASAFFVPAQEALLGDVAGADLMQAVTGRTLVQFAGLASGSLIGGSARWIGTESALALQCGLLLLGLVPLTRMRGIDRPRSSTRSRPIAEIQAGLLEVLSSERLRALTLLVMGVGLFFIGPFFVVFPLAVRDAYGGEVGVLSLLLMMFPLGSIIGSALLLLRGGIARKGRALLIALVCGAVCVGTQIFQPPLPVFLGLVLLWGMCGSVFLNTSRTLYQQAASVSQRGRVLSIYAMGFMGMAPLGAIASGLLADRIGALATCAAAAGGMLLLVTLVATRTRVAELR